MFRYLATLQTQGAPVRRFPFAFDTAAPMDGAALEYEAAAQYRAQRAGPMAYVVSVKPMASVKGA